MCHTERRQWDGDCRSLTGFHAAIYNDVSSAHQHYNFLQKLRSGTRYSMEDVYQIIWVCAASFACFWGGGLGHAVTSVLAFESGRETGRRLRSASELSEHPIQRRPSSRCLISASHQICTPPIPPPQQSTQCKWDLHTSHKKERSPDRTNSARRLFH